LSLSGQLTVNKVAATESNHRQAYVQQEDVFYSMLTVREVGTTDVLSRPRGRHRMGHPLNKLQTQKADINKLCLLHHTLASHHTLVTQTLSMAAELRLPPEVSPAERQQYIERLIKTLGLSKVGATCCGKALCDAAVGLFVVQS
jgi:ABC-type multidrug transport system ATPase subunit